MNSHMPPDGNSPFPNEIDLSDIFIGREQQLDQFRFYLERWQRLAATAGIPDLKAPPSPNDKIAGFVALLHGRGGFGKSTLLKRYREIALEYSDNIQESDLIDWEFAAQERRALFSPAQRDVIDASQYFSFIRDHLALALGRPRTDFKEYQVVARAVDDAKKQAQGVLKGLQQDDRYAWLRSLPGEVVLALIQSVPVVKNVPLLKNDAITKATSNATNAGVTIGAEQITQVWTRLHERLGDDLSYYLNAPWRLGGAIGHDLAQFARRRPILIFFDTYEEIDEGDKLLQMIMGAAGGRVGWVIAGRDNLWAGVGQRRRSLEVEYGYRDLVLPDRRMVIDFSVDGVGDFTSSDIEEYFTQLSRKALRPALPAVSEKDAVHIRDVTGGVPLAVKIAAGLYLESRDLALITESLDGKREIVDQMVERYLLHTRFNPADRSRLYGLALLRRPDEQRALTAALDVPDNYDAELARLHRRYGFIFTKQEQPALHQEVRYFLRLWLLQHRTSSPEIMRVISRLREALFTSFQELEAQRHYASLRQRLEDEQWRGLYLDLTEQQYWLDPAEGVAYVLSFMFAASVYQREANRVARTIGEFFQAALVQPYRKQWDWANQSLVYSTSRNPLPEELSGLKELVRLASQNKLAFFPPMPPFQEELEAAVWWRLGEAYQGNNPDGSVFWYEKALGRLPDEKDLRKALVEALWDREHESVSEEKEPTTFYRLEEQTQKASEKSFYRHMWDSIKRTLHISSQTSLDLLISEVQRFFDAAGFRLVTTLGSAGFFYQPVIPLWQKKIKHDVYIQISTGQPLDGDDVLRIRDAIQKRLEDISLAFVVVDKPVEDNAWLHIAALRTKNFNVIPIPSTLLFESRTMSKANAAGILLDKHLERFLGQGVDPYNIRHPVFDVLNFFGREALARNLVEQIASGQPMGLFGLRKIGKSSLMRYIQRLMPCPTACLDLQAGAELVGLYERILHAWNNDAWTRFRIDLNLGDIHIDSGEPNTDFVKITQQTLDKLSIKRPEARLAIFLDEIELIMPPLDAVGPLLERYLSLMRTLRGLVQEDGRVFLMVAGIDPAINRLSRWGDEQKQNPFFMLLQEFYLPPLLESDCIQMIRNIGTQVELSYSDEAAIYIARASGGHPSLARQLCSLAYRQRHQQPGEVTLIAIQKATERFLSDPKYATSLNDTGLWGEVTNSKLWGEQAAQANQRILFILAQSTDSATESVITNGPDPIAGRSALFALCELHVIRPVEESMDAADSNYTITFGLLRAWIRRMRLGLEE